MRPGAIAGRVLGAFSVRVAQSKQRVRQGNAGVDVGQRKVMMTGS